MVLSTLCFVVVGVSAAAHADPFQHHNHAHVHDDGHHRHGCKTKTPNRAEMDETARMISTYQRNNLAARSGRNCDQCIEIDTYFTIFHPADQQSEVTPETAQNQFNVLVEDFKGSPFTFKLRGTEWVGNTKYFNSMENNEEAIGSMYRKGGFDTLNVYFGVDGSWAYFPENQGDEPWYGDGAWIAYDTMPGFDEEYTGSTLTHEVGHWLGLFHTFEGETCEEGHPGDYVNDTPQHLEPPLFTCPTGRNSCPNSDPDPIHNYMDYTSDACYSEFSPGQKNRMFLVWSLFRKQDEICSPDHSLFEFHLTGDSQLSFMDWTLSADDGSFSINQKEDNTEGEYTQVHGNDVIEHDICIAANKDYTFTLRDALPTGNGDFKLFLDGKLIHDGSNFDGDEVVAFSTVDGGEGDPSPTPAPAAECVILEVQIKTDDYGSETAFEVTDGSGASVLSGGNFGNNIVESLSECVEPDKCYTMKVTDEYGDGMCCEYGDGVFTANLDGATVFTGGTFGSEIERHFGNCGEGDSRDTLKIALTTDSYAGESHLVVRDVVNSKTLLNEKHFEDNTSYNFSIDVDSRGCYKIRLRDSYGDGICCSEGDGFLVAEVGAELVANFGDFDFDAAESFGDGCK